jgi:trehalose 6-phosphate synthase
VANRAPVSHKLTSENEVTVARSASGLVTALEPLVATQKGTWVAHGSGEADRLVVDADQGVVISASHSRYRLRYVWLTDDEYRGFYEGFANEGLWPLCHDLDVPPVFRRADFAAYEAANRKFVAATVEESAGGAQVVLVQDYHFALAPQLLREASPSSTIGAFWHIPWPTPRVLELCPWAERLLEGLLGSNVVGFQTDEDCSNFLSCVKSWLGANADVHEDIVHYRGSSTRVRAYPVGVECDSHVLRTIPPPHECRDRLRRQLGLPPHVRLGVGVDRLDYTKGIPQKFLAIERLLEQHPELHGSFQFIQIAEPSRSSLPAYQKARRLVLETCDRVNNRFRTNGFEPIRLLEAHHDANAVFRYYRAADVCYVGSLRDGMNLVAKEFVSARNDERGVLVLSALAGAAQQLRSALLVDPYEIDSAAQALHRALCMSEDEQAVRMRRLRSVVRASSARWWGNELLQDLYRHSVLSCLIGQHCAAPEPR